MENPSPLQVVVDGDWYTSRLMLNRREQQKRAQHFEQVRQAKRNGDETTLKRMRRERKQYTYRRWYMTNRDTELVKIRERRAKRLQNVHTRELKSHCCSSEALGNEPPPEKGFTFWVSRCTVCQREQCGVLGVDSQGRAGTYFRGVWFSFIYPGFGVGVTQTGEMLSLN